MAESESSGLSRLIITVYISWHIANLYFLGDKMNGIYKKAELSDCKLAYKEKGQGEVLILLHGNGENSEYFKLQFDFFSKHFRVIALDSRGHGKSERGKKKLSLNQLASDLREFMDAMKIEKASLLGFSDGGNIALLFALQNVSRVNKLILYGANLNTKGVLLSCQLPVYINSLLLFLPSLFLKKAKSKREILSLMIGQPNITKGDLSALTLPVLVIAGTKDMIKESHTRYISDWIKNSKLIFLNGSHFVSQENPDGFNSECLSFLNHE